MYHRFHHDAGDQNIVMTTWRRQTPGGGTTMGPGGGTGAAWRPGAGRHSRSISASSNTHSLLAHGLTAGAGSGPAGVGSGVWERSMSFLKLVNIPGLSSTRGRKTQTWRTYVYGEECIGSIVQSTTTLSDVPYADAFVVQESIIVRLLPAASSREQPSVTVSVYIQVQWSKSVMIK